MKLRSNRLGATGRLCLELVVALNFRLVRDRIPAFTHDPGDAVFPAPNTGFDKIPVNSRRPVNTVTGFVKNADFVLQDTVFKASPAFRVDFSYA